MHASGEISHILEEIRTANRDERYLAVRAVRTKRGPNAVGTGFFWDQITAIAINVRSLS